MSPAKTNWYLSVRGKRDDGYHDIVTIFHELELADLMTFDRTTTNEIELVGFPDDIAVETNLVTRAYRAMQAEFGSRVRGMRVEIEKQIPAGGGLGGGSSNAATTLRAISDMFDLGATPEDLERLGATLGSDVPFFVRGGCAVGRGRGEILEPLERAPAVTLLLAFPAARVSTAEAYRALSGKKRSPAEECLEQTLHWLAQPAGAGPIPPVHNDFESVVCDAEWFVEASTTLRNIGAESTFLSGSGSTIVGVLGGATQAVALADHAGGNLNVLITRTRAV